MSKYLEICIQCNDNCLENPKGIKKEKIHSRNESNRLAKLYQLLSHKMSIYNCTCTKQSYVDVTVYTYMQS